jgi:STAM-binding protein
MAPTTHDPARNAYHSSAGAARRPTPSEAQSARRPATIAELAERARETNWDPSLSLKHWLKTAERYRDAGYAFIDSGDLEQGFVELARAATIVMEKAPTHRDYQTLLKPAMRKNLGSVRLPPPPHHTQSRSAETLV